MLNGGQVEGQHSGVTCESQKPLLLLLPLLYLPLRQLLLFHYGCGSLLLHIVGATCCLALAATAVVVVVVVAIRCIRIG